MDINCKIYKYHIINIKMKIVFKGIDLVKMYGEEMEYQKIVHFVKNNFPNTPNFTLTFQD